MMLSLLLALTLLHESALGYEYHISSASDFISFVSTVNKGTNYAGTTIILDSDLSLAGKTFEPIGNTTYSFRGTFDGQGHVISGLVISSSLQ